MTLGDSGKNGLIPREAVNRHPLAYAALMFCLFFTSIAVSGDVLHAMLGSNPFPKTMPYLMGLWMAVFLTAYPRIRARLMRTPHGL